MKQLTPTYSIELIQSTPTLKQTLDIQYLSELAIQDSGFSDWSYNRDKMINFIQTSTDKGQLLALLHDKEDAVGILYAMVEEYPFSDELVAREFLWYTGGKPKASILLYKTYIAWAQAVGATQVLVGSHRGLSQDDKYLKRHGFQELETQYIFKGE